MNKPHLHVKFGIWFCNGNNTVGYGMTPKQAYDSYISMLMELMYTRSDFLVEHYMKAGKTGGQNSPDPPVRTDVSKVSIT